MIVVQLQLPVAPHGVPPVSRQMLPGQQGLLVEQVCPAFGQLDAWQVPAVAPLALTHERPVQQSADAVHAWACGEQSFAGWQLLGPPSVDAQIPAQHSTALAQVEPVALQLPASTVWVGNRQAKLLPEAPHTVPAQQLVPAPPSAPTQVVPSGRQVCGPAQVSPVPPSPLGRHGAPPQHWSLNWQALPVAMQQGATPVYPVRHEPLLPPKQRGIPELSSLQTSFIPSQQFCEAFTLPPSRSTGAPQMLPRPLHAMPLSQRLVPGSQVTPPWAGAPPQQATDDRHELPVRRQPVAGAQTVAPEPRSTQVREQQLVPPLHGLPS